jgi:hypothetical protein
MNRKVPQPRTEEIMKDGIFQRDNLIYLFMKITGTWQVEINGLLLMPGEWFQEKFASNLIFDGSYTIRFVRDCAADAPVSVDLYSDLTAETVWAVQDNPNLKQGKFIYIRLATATDD